MHFDQLKSAWQDSFKEKGLSKDQISDMMKVKRASDAILAKIRKNYSYSLMVLAVLYLTIVTGLFAFIQSKTAFIVSFLAIVIFGLFASYIYRSLVQATKTWVSDDVKTTLGKTIMVLEKFLRFGMGNLYKYLLIPFSLILGIAIGILCVSGFGGFFETVCNLENKSIIKIILVIVVGSILIIPFSQYLMNKLYKQHLDELKKCYKELEDIPN